MDTVFRLQYPTIDDFTDRLRTLGRNTPMYKIDLSRAFRQLRVDPADYPLLCLEWRWRYYWDTSVAFGHRAGGLGCIRLTDSIRYLHSKQGFHLTSYVDDLMSAELGPRAQAGFDTLCKLLSNLCIPLSQSKIIPPSTTMVCLGIHIDSVLQTLSIPKQKLRDIVDKCIETRNKSHITKKGLQSVIGCLMFVHKAIKPSRLFVNRLLESLRNFGDRKVIPVDSDMKKDFNWFIEFVNYYNGTSKYIHEPLDVGITVALDACPSGLGGVFPLCLASIRPTL